MKVNQLVWALLLAGAVAVKLPAQTLQTLTSFNGTNGANPWVGLALGNDGNFYGTTGGGGSNNNGTIFQVTTNGTLTTLYAFTNGTDGSYPNAVLTLGKDGNFYGTTYMGGSNYGTVFKVTTNGTLTTLYTFTGGSDGKYPQAALTPGADGSFYSTTSGSLGYQANFGTVFKVTTNGTLTTLYAFTGVSDGGYPNGLTLDNDGNFYGTTMGINGSSDYGTVFKVTTNGMLTTLIAFSSTNGAHPWAGLTLGSDGNFYGTTVSGGYNNLNDGTVFKVTTNGTLTTLIAFNSSNGANPAAALTLRNDGNFYGTTWKGGSSGVGTIFQVTTNGALTTLVSFNNTNGALLLSGLTLGKDNNIYGTTAEGGSCDDGTVFCLVLPQVVTPPIIPPTLTLQFWSGYPLLSIFGTLGDTYTVEYTTNLAVPNWIPMLVVPNLSISPFQMIDPAGAGQPARFYRAYMQ